MRSAAEKRHNDWKKAIRKQKIIQQYGFDYYDNLHQYSKNKIHCSCPLCANKTRENNLPIRDKKRREEMEEQLLDAEE